MKCRNPERSRPVAKGIRSRWFGALAMLGACVPAPDLGAQTTQVEVRANMRHTVGGISMFDRSKFVTIHSTHTDNEWTGVYQNSGNFTNDLLADFILGNDVYFGRDTGYVSWYLNNNIDENPSKPGWARVSGSTYSIATQGTNARNSYQAKTAIHPYESRAASDIMGAQYERFWPGSGNTQRGWGLSSADTVSEPLGSATGNYMGNFLNHFYGTATQPGRPLPRFVEVMNEPDWPLFDNGSTPPATVWKFHNSVAAQIRTLHPNALIGGFCAAFPDFEKNNFQEWTSEWKTYVDTCGPNMDFHTLHFYDFEDSTTTYRKGSNVEATLDMLEHYSRIALGNPLPFVISEFGGRARNMENGPWSALRDWKTIKTLSSYVMSFADRPNLVLKTIPFIVCKGEWGRDAYPYAWRLMRQANEPASYTGDWVYTEMVKFYQLWSGVNGTRVKCATTDPDVQVDAYVDGNKLHLILNNLNQSSVTVGLRLSGITGNTLQSLREKNLYWNGTVVALDDINHPGTLTQVLLRSEGTAVLEYTFASPVTVDQTADEVKHYATTYFQSVTGGQARTFVINGVGKGALGEAVLRLGIGRAHNLSKQPVVLCNGTSIPVPTDFMGHEGDARSSFFGLLEIPVPYHLLQTDNTFSVTFPDTGGYISSVSLRAFALSGNPTGEFRIASIQQQEPDVMLTIRGGEPGGSFDLLFSSDLTAPSGEWGNIRSGLSFDASGEATVSAPIAGERGFFRARQVIDVTPPPNVTDLFEFNIAANDWSGKVDSPSNSGAFRFNNQNAATVNGFIMQLTPGNNLTMYHNVIPPDGPHLIRSVFTVQDAAKTNRTFTLNSLNWRNTSNGDGTQSTLTGRSGGATGTVQWTLSGVSQLANLVTAPTTGSFANPIDTLIWEAPAYMDGIFGSILDNVSVTVMAP